MLPDEQIEMYEIQLAGIVQTPFADFGFVGLDDDKNDVETSVTLL